MSGVSKQGRLHDAGIGGVRAMQLIQKHGSLEAVMAQLDTSRYGVPDPFPFAEARTLFKGEPLPRLPTRLRPCSTVEAACFVRPCMS